jgi:hypothetical protein
MPVRFALGNVGNCFPMLAVDLRADMGLLC